MYTQAIKFFGNWRALLLIATIPALTNCSRIDGSVELNNSSGEPYSFAGAKVEVFNLDRAATMGGANKTLKSAGTVDADGNTISLQVITATIDDNALYDVEIHCPTNNTIDTCNVESALHVVLSGAQLKADGWQATALSEAVFHNIAYYAASEYSAGEIQSMQDRYADALLAAPNGSAETYADVLAWNPAATDAVRRPYALGKISEALAHGISDSDLKLLVRQWIDPYVTSIDLPSGADFRYYNILAVANGYAYIGGVRTGLNVVDIHNPELPTLVAEASPSSVSRYDVKVVGSHAYTIDAGALHVFDVSNPQQPILTGQLFLDEDAHSVVVSGNYAYVLEEGSFFIVDVSNPAAPISKAKVSAGARTIDAAGNIVGVIDETVRFVDVSNPLAPSVVGQLDIYESKDIRFSSGYAYISVADQTTGFTGINVVDMSNPAAPVVVAQLPLADPGSLELSGTQLYVVGIHTVSRVDISNPTAPVLTATLNTPEVFTTIAADGKFLYTLAFGKTLSVIDVDRATGPAVQTANLATTVLDRAQIAASGNLAYLFNRNSNGSLSIIDASNPATPTLITTHSSDWFFDGAAVSGNYVFSANAYSHALSVTDVSDPQAPLALESLPLDESGARFDGPVDIALAGNYAYLPWGSFTDSSGNGGAGCSNPATGQIGGLFVVDISAPTTPAITGHVCTTRHADFVTASGDRAYVVLASDLQEVVNVNHPASLQVVDVSNPASPALAGSVALSVSPNFIAVSANHVWVTEGFNGVDIVDVGNAATPVVSAHIETSGYAASVTFDEHYAYVADGYSGVLIFDTTNPAAPALVASASTISNALSVAVIGEYFYVATGYGVEVFKAPAPN